MSDSLGRPVQPDAMKRNRHKSRAELILLTSKTLEGSSGVGKTLSRLGETTRDYDANSDLSMPESSLIARFVLTQVNEVSDNALSSQTPAISFQHLGDRRIRLGAESCIALQTLTGAVAGSCAKLGHL